MALNDSLLRYQKSSVAPKEVLGRLQDLLNVLRARSNDAEFTSRLADYCFFPLSGVFRDRQKFPVKAVELALQCLQILLRTEWSKIEDANVAVQLLILLTFLADTEPKDAKQEVRSSEALREAALLCMKILFDAVSKSSQCQGDVLAAKNMPPLGHAVIVMLDGLKAGRDVGLQEPAIDALQGFVAGLATPDVLQSFFPGVVSALVHVLTLGASSRPSYTVLQKSLQLMRVAIKVVLSDSRLRESSSDAGGRLKAPTEQNAKWHESARAQLKVALSTVSRLREHERIEVRTALGQLCHSILSDCQNSLSDCGSIAFETLVTLSKHDDDFGMAKELEILVATQPVIAEVARSVLYDWLVSLPRVLTLNDIDSKTALLTKISAAHRLLVDTEVDLDLINDLLATNLIDGLTSQPFSRSGSLELEQADSFTSVVALENPRTYDLVELLTDTHGDITMLQKVQTLVQHVASTQAGLPMAQVFMNSARTGQGHIQVINFWLAVSVLRSRKDERLELDSFVTDAVGDADEASLREDAYDFSLAVLNSADHSEDIDSRLIALALEAVTLQAQQMKLDFRPELVDALYPVLHLMGSSQRLLRRTALSSLDRMASATGYENTQALLVQNVDYLVNAISLKLNAFDISPEAPQVLLMMIKLCGPKLLPYLEDLVDSTFEALEHFHGYANLVELLFSVLNGIVEEGSRAPQFSIEAPARKSHLKPARTPCSMTDTITNFKERRLKFEQEEHPIDATNHSALPEGTPHRPWKELRTFNEELSATQAPAPDSDETDTPSEPQPPEATLTKTYTMLQRIANLTQYHLSSSSASIRALLLSLLTKAIPYLSHHDDTFLPLVHTLWPILVPRLADPEAFVVAGVLDVMACFCEGAGDFMSSRIEGVWPEIRRIWKQTHDSMRPPPKQAQRKGRKALIGNTGASGRGLRTTRTEDLVLRPVKGDQQSDSLTFSGSTPPSEADAAVSPYKGRYIPTTALTISNALTRFLIAVCSYVRIPETIFTEILNDMLHMALVDEERSDVRQALERLNADAVWLVMERARWKKEPAVREAWQVRKPADIEVFSFAAVY